MANEQNKGTQDKSFDSGNESTAFSEFSEKDQDKSTTTGSTQTGSTNASATGSTSPGSTGSSSTSSTSSTGYSGTGSATTDRTGTTDTSSTGSSAIGSTSGISGGTSSSLGSTGSSSSGSSSTGSTSGSGGSTESSTGLSVESAKETAKGLYDQAKSTAGQAFGAATQRATEALDEKKVTVASGLTSVADSIKQVGENLNTNADPNPIAETAAKYTNSLAQQIENLSGYFERKDVRDMVRDVETFARRNPAYFIGGAVALGFLAARFLKSSNPKQLRGGSGRTYGEGYDTGKALTAGDTTPGSSQF